MTKQRGVAMCVNGLVVGIFWLAVTSFVEDFLWFLSVASLPNFLVLQLTSLLLLLWSIFLCRTLWFFLLANGDDGRAW